MLNIKEDSTLVGVSELRTKMDEILKESKLHKIIIEKRNKPVAVLMSLEKYKHIEEALDLLEDRALGYLAKEREKKSTSKDYIDIDEAQHKLRRK
ncbi:MAG: type II toxin-antitoxin system Phd/YefM family antitoxin [Candidatus Omnitrophica bacterium]|nr:type II toxin-antitoxin system Phd/YefM family antitoxin [Candidatus Omnitrophota bacterium]MBU4141201.1 type II toxin-antitoxin system Phd/YefM family antitoxin [Candidatus Omnitrophota bacterium]